MINLLCMFNDVPAEVIAAWIALAGVLISALVSFIIGFWSRRYNYHQLFAETVSQNRMDWINVWRENLSTFLAIAKVLHECGNVTTQVNEQNKQQPLDCHDKCELVQKMEYARRMITTRLNLTEEKHQLMYSAIGRLQHTESNEKFKAACENIEEIARSILKEEWERVKEEAKGKRR